MKEASAEGGGTGGHAAKKWVACGTVTSPWGMADDLTGADEAVS